VLSPVSHSKPLTILLIIVIFMAMINQHSLSNVSDFFSEVYRCLSQPFRDVLHRHSSMFDPPTILSPHREQDHAIELILDSTHPLRKL